MCVCVCVCYEYSDVGCFQSVCVFFMMKWDCGGPEICQVWSIQYYGHSMNKEEDTHGYMILEFERFIELVLHVGLPLGNVPAASLSTS